MGIFKVRKDKEDALLNHMEALGILEKDLVEKFVRASGKGGQKVNKTSSCVYLKHLPTGIEVKVSREREQAVNRFLARRELPTPRCSVTHGLTGHRRIQGVVLHRGSHAKPKMDAQQLVLY